MKKILRAVLGDKTRKRLQRIQMALGLFYTKDLLRYLGERAEIGEYSYGKPRVLHWQEQTKLKIGKYCSISDEVTIFLGGNHRADWVSTFPFAGYPHLWPSTTGITEYNVSRGDVVIGNDVWIGYGAAIMSGVRIGDGAVIGAYALVTKNVAPYAIVGGNPTKEIRKRFDDETITKLLRLGWWNWSVEKVQKNAALLSSGDIEKILAIEE